MPEPTTKKPFTVAVMRHSGTHLITPIVRGLTGKTVYSPKGDDGLNCIPSSVVIVFQRDPRNWMVSVFKWKVAGRTPPPGGVAGQVDTDLAAFLTRSKKPDAIGYLGYVKLWADRWVGYPGALTVRFEDLQSEQRGIEVVCEIQRFLGAPAAAADPAAVYASVFGKSVTYTGQPSDWRKWFGPATKSAWAANGGDDLVKKMGYQQ